MSDTSSTLRCRACGGELGSHFLWTGDGFSYHHECFPSSPKEDEAASLRAQITSLQKELAERTAELKKSNRQALDNGMELCRQRSRAEAAEARADTLARRVEGLEAALKSAAFKLISDQYDLRLAHKVFENGWQWPDDDDSPTVVHGTVAQVLAALQQTERGNG